MKKRIFYSIDIECEDEDLFNFVRLKNPKGFQYEYIEDIPEVKQESLFELIADCINPVENQKLLDECQIKLIK